MLKSPSDNEEAADVFNNPSDTSIPYILYFTTSDKKCQLKNINSYQFRASGTTVSFTRFPARTTTTSTG